MSNIEVKNVEGQAAGSVELSSDVFGIEPNIPVMHQVVVAYESNLRQGTHSVKNRHEVSGGGKKPYRQKGTGNARHHGNRAPQFRHGGVVFAPKPRDYRISVPRKVRRLAMKSALSSKAAESKIFVVDGLKFEEAKTKACAAFLKKLGVEGDAMIITENVDENVVRSARNIPDVQTTIATILSPYEIMKARALVVDKAALSKIEEVYC